MVFLKLFAIFFKIGLFSFGGGYGMISVIQKEVTNMGWATPDQYANIVAISQITPGPIATNVATYIGTNIFMDKSILFAIIGSIVATIGVVLPSFIVVIIAANLFEKFKTSAIVDGAMTGIRAAVIGIMTSAVLSFSALSFYNKNGFSFLALLVFFVILGLSYKTEISAVWLILISAILGLILL